MSRPPRTRPSPRDEPKKLGRCLDLTADFGRRSSERASRGRGQRRAARPGRWRHRRRDRPDETGPDTRNRPGARPARRSRPPTRPQPPVQARVSPLTRREASRTASSAAAVTPATDQRPHAGGLGALEPRGDPPRAPDAVTAPGAKRSQLVDETIRGVRFGRLSWNDLLGFRLGEPPSQAHQGRSGNADAAVFGDTPSTPAIAREAQLAPDLQHDHLPLRRRQPPEPGLLTPTRPTRPVPPPTRTEVHPLDLPRPALGLAAGRRGRRRPRRASSMRPRLTLVNRYAFGSSAACRPGPPEAGRRPDPEPRPRRRHANRSTAGRTRRGSDPCRVEPEACRSPSPRPAMTAPVPVLRDEDAAGVRAPSFDFGKSPTACVGGQTDPPAPSRRVRSSNVETASRPNTKRAGSPTARLAPSWKRARW